MESSHSQSLPLHHCHVHQLRATLNRTYALLHILALTAIFYYRAAFFFNRTHPNYYMLPFLPWLAIFAAELLLSFLWLLKQPFYWRSVTRTAFPERLPKDEKLLPGIDVFICTADPKREPTFEVMNTVISAMVLDYPAEKLSVYLSDDGGSSVTLIGLKEAWIFATWWLPFCRKYNVKTICPLAYFKESEEENPSWEFIEDRKIVKEKYEAFKMQLLSKIQRDEVEGDSKRTAGDHPAVVQVINANSIEDDASASNPEQGEMPFLAYVAREKRPSHSHNFKAGALNALLRASSSLSNSPYILVLDCDMYCNDSISARQAMCFFLDTEFSSSLGWVQYPQKFHNTNDNDIYASDMRTLFCILWPGADGLQGPVISGTNFYIKREALYGVGIDDGSNLSDLKETFGPSNEFIRSLGQLYKPNALSGRKLSSVLLQEAEFLASCSYEKDTKWGEKVGFRYGSVVEDALTGFALQSKGWRSVLLSPSRPQFLGSSTTNLSDNFIQGIRWVVGLLEIGLSKHCPLTIPKSRMQILHKMSSSWVLLFPLGFLPLLILAIIPPLCFLYAIPLYPKVSDPFFMAFGFAFVASLLRHLCEFLNCGGSVRAWYNEQLTSMIKGLTCYVYGALEFAMTKLGLRQSSFIPTNKAGDEDKSKYYQMGKYDFRISNMFLVPVVCPVILNLACFVGGIARVIVAGNWAPMLGQIFVSLYVLVMSFPVIEGMLLRRDKGRVPVSAALTSTAVSLVIMNLGYFIL